MTRLDVGEERVVDPMLALAAMLSATVCATVLSSTLRLAALATMMLCVALVASRSSDTVRLALIARLLTLPVLLLGFHLGSRALTAGFGNLTLYDLAEAAVAPLRVTCSMLALVAFIGSVDPKLLMVRLSMAGVPDRFVFAAYLMLRFATILAEDAGSMRASARARVHGGGVVLRLKCFVGYATALTLLALRRSEQTALAMETRGFDPTAKRTFLQRGAWRRAGLLSYVFALALPWLAAVPWSGR